MSALARLQIIGSGKPYYGFTKLSIGYHEFVRFRMIRNKFATKESGGKSMIVELENETIIFIALSKTSIYCSMVEPVKLKLFCDDAKDEK